MSNQYMPKEKYEKAYVPMATSCGTGCPSSLAAVMDQYIKCSSWTMYDYDSVCLSSVTLKKSIEEAVLTDTVSVPASEIPSGSTVLLRYKKRIPVVATQTAAESDMELGPLVQLLMISKKLQYEQALEMAKDHVGKRKAQQPASFSSSPFQEVDYADVVVTRVVGPLNVGARFDYMIYNSLLKEGVLYRKAPQTTTSSAAAVSAASTGTGGSCYTLSFDSAKYGADRMPKLVAHTDRVKLPGEVARGDGYQSSAAISK